MKGSVVLWLILYGAGLFAAGFMAHKLMADTANQAPPTYLERLAVELGLTDDQKEHIHRLLEEEDRQIQVLWKEEEGKRIRQRIHDIRKGIFLQISEVLDEEQKPLFDGPDPLMDGPGEGE